VEEGAELLAFAEEARDVSGFLFPSSLSRRLAAIHPAG
jgi:hypothetical protein